MPIPPETKPYWCEKCHLHNIRQLGEPGRPWHCNDCGFEFPYLVEDGNEDRKLAETDAIKKHLWKNI